MSSQEKILFIQFKFLGDIVFLTPILKAYKEQQWDEAIKYFEVSEKLEIERYGQGVTKTNPSKIYIERCQEFKQLPPPPNWDGVYNLSHK
jgi:adenylate cyclase